MEKGGQNRGGKRKLAISEVIHPPKTPKFSWKGLAVCLLMTCWVGVSVIISQLITYYVAVNLVTSEAELEMPLQSAIYSAAVYIVAGLMIVLIPWLVFKKWRPSREEIGLSGAMTWTDLLLAPVSLILYLLVTYALTLLFSALFPWFEVDQAQSVGFDNLTTNLDLLIGFVALVVIAPVAEELIFRGWLYGKLRERVALPVAILLVSLLFGLMHGQWNVGVDVFAMSIILCLQREVTGTIYSGVLLHMLKNGIAFYLLYIAV